MVYFYLWIFLKKLFELKSHILTPSLFEQFIKYLYRHAFPGDGVQFIQFLLFSLQRTKGIKEMEQFIKKSQVLW